MTFVVVVLGAGLVPATPLRPGQDVIGGLLEGEDQPPQEPANLGDAQREVRPRLALNAARGFAS
jgi:hypothetical protein